MTNEVQARTGDVSGFQIGVHVPMVSGLRRTQTSPALGFAAAAQAAARSLAFAAALVAGLVGCSFDDSPGALERGHAHRFCVRGTCSDVDDAGDVLQLGHVDDAGDQVEDSDASPAASSDAGAGDLEDDASTFDAGKTVVSDAGPLERDATVSDTNDASSSADAGAVDAGEPGPVLCTAMCSDGSFKCPSTMSGSGFVCRSWPPCYCTPDAGI